MNEWKSRIIDLENKYYDLFSTKETDGSVIRYQDRELPDMYHHNFTLIPQGVATAELDGIIRNEIARRKAAGQHFLLVKFEDPVDKAKIPAEELVSFTELEYYRVTPAAARQMKDKDSVEVIKLSDVLVEEAKELDELCETSESLDFTNRRFDRRSKVYLSEAPLDNYLALVDWEVVGSCDYFAMDGACMLEDFVVDPAYRNQGIGTALLKTLAEHALTTGNDLVFLSAESGETAREMYQKLGFDVIWVSQEALYKF